MSPSIHVHTHTWETIIVYDDIDVYITRCHRINFYVLFVIGVAADLSHIETPAKVWIHTNTLLFHKFENKLKGPKIF